MPGEPRIKVLSINRRRWFFRSLVLVFVLVLPVVIFYTTGYRLSFENDATSIVTTGGMYIDIENIDVQVYLNEEEYVRPRLFQSAYYLQNITAGQHRVVVQADGAQTWVKQLPVDAHRVIEANAFNMPVIARLRPITEFETSTGTAVYFDVSAMTVFGEATSTEPFFIATSSATSSFESNPEYEFVMSLFASSSSSTRSVFADDRLDAQRFRFLTEEERLATTTPTTSQARIERNNIELVTSNFELYAVWQGRDNTIPFYFCISSTTRASTSQRYGQHVADAIFENMASTTATSTTFNLNNRTCRTEIKLNRLQQDVYMYRFFSNRANLALLHLTEGLYVTEIDDRAWQNTQPLLLGNDFLVLVENETIYINRQGYLFELVPEIASD